jgi:hypothetical protein
MMRTALGLVLAAATAGALAVPGAAAPPNRPHPEAGLERPVDVELNEIGRYTAADAEFDEGGAEIVAYDASTQRLFVANGSEITVDVIDVSDPSDPQLVDQVDVAAFGAGVNGVGAAKGLVGVAISPENAQDERGSAVFLDAATLEVVDEVEVGFLPDALLFAPDGATAVVANEGEPSDDYLIDPPGTISVIDLDTFEVAEVGFAELGVDDVVNSESFRSFGPNAGDLAVDIEPENIAFDADSTTAWVTLQENNAIAEVDLVEGELVEVFALGFKDWTTAGNGFDASNADGEIRIRDWPVLGIPQPDAVAAYEVRGRTLLVTANEGDARDYEGYSEEVRLGDVGLCEGFTYDGMGAAELELDENLGRLNITTANGFNEDLGCVHQPYAYGARSFSIYTPEGDLIYDSGSDFEEITAEILGRNGFNANNDETGEDAFDSRSDDKGPEPEGVAVGQAYGSTYAFIGLERVGGVMTYKVSNPRRPEFVAYDIRRDFDAPTPEEAVDLGPEGVLFVSAEESPTGRPLVVLSHEVTGTTTIYQIDPVTPSNG